MTKFIYPVLVLIFIRICVCLFISHRNSSILILFSIKKVVNILWNFSHLLDTRLQHLPFTSIESIIVVITLYLLFVLKWGPKLMEKRRPYNIERILLIYNAIQVMANSGIFVYVSIIEEFHISNWDGNCGEFGENILIWFQVLYQLSVFSEREINFWCEEIDFSDSFLGIRSAQTSYCYYLVKLLDLLDTVFFVLRKRTRQISFLHVYHHVAILVGAYIAVAWAPGKS